MPKLLYPNKCDFILVRGTRDGTRKAGETCDKVCGYNRDKCSLHQEKYLKQKKERNDHNNSNYLINKVERSLKSGVEVNQESYNEKKLEYRNKLVEVKKQINGINIFLGNVTVEEIKYRDPKFYFGRKFIIALQDAKIEKTGKLDKINEMINNANNYISKKEHQLNMEKNNFIRMMNTRERNEYNHCTLESKFKINNKDRYEQLQKYNQEGKTDEYNELNNTLNDECREYINEMRKECEKDNDPYKYDDLFEKEYKFLYDEIEEIKGNCPYGLKIFDKRTIFREGILKLREHDYKSSELLKIAIDILYNEYGCDNSYLIIPYTKSKHKAQKEYPNLLLLMKKYQKKYDTYAKILNIIEKSSPIDMT
jgi:hypothetical protein